MRFGKNIRPQRIEMVEVRAHDGDEGRNSFFGDAKTHKVSLTPKSVEIVGLIPNQASSDRRRIHIERGNMRCASPLGCWHEALKAGPHSVVLGGKAPNRLSAKPGVLV